MSEWNKSIRKFGLNWRLVQTIELQYINFHRVKLEGWQKLRISTIQIINNTVIKWWQNLSAIQSRFQIIRNLVHGKKSYKLHTQDTPKTQEIPDECTQTLNDQFAITFELQKLNTKLSINSELRFTQFVKI